MPAPIDALHSVPHTPRPLHTLDALPFSLSAPVSGTASAPLPLALTPQSAHLTLSAQAKVAAPPPLATPMLWPVEGVSGPMHHLVATLVQQLTAPTLPQRVVGIQPWPMALAETLTPALQTWLVQHGQIQTPQGPRGFSLSLRIPTQWLPQPPPNPDTANITNITNISNIANTPLQALQSGTFALVLQSPGPGASRTSALLILDFQPLLPSPAQAAVYGRDMLQPRQDPWLQMAVLQASGHIPPYEDEKAHLGSALCDTPECPYVGRAACIQPFCMAMRSLLPVSTTPANVRA